MCSTFIFLEACGHVEEQLAVPKGSTREEDPDVKTAECDEQTLSCAVSVGRRRENGGWEKGKRDWGSAGHDGKSEASGD